MNQTSYDEVAAKLLGVAHDIETAKRPGYTLGNEDVLHNFKSVAKRVGITTEQAWGVYFLKHIDAIISGTCKPELPVAEALEGRFADAINYLKLGWAIVNDKPRTASLPSFYEVPPNAQGLAGSQALAGHVQLRGNKQDFLADPRRV